MVKTVTIDVRMMNSSGIGTYIRNLVPRIISRNPDIAFNLIGGIEPLQSLASQYSNLRIIESSCPIYSLSEQWELWKKIPKDTDLHWTPHYNIPLLFRGNLLATVHDLFPFRMLSGAGQLHKKAYARVMFNSLARAKAVICVSDFTNSELKRVVAKARSRTIHNGVDGSWFKLAKETSLHPHPYLLFVGNIKPHKNIKNLLKAFAMLMDRIPQDLVIIGQKDGFITSDKDFVKDLQDFQGRVYFKGTVSDECLKQFFANADGLVFPSKYEGFGLPPLEAMACGCPVVASNAASLPEVCGDAALYCDPESPESIGEAIYRLVTDAYVRKDLITKGIERARLFDWGISAELTNKLIHDLLYL